MQKGIVKIMRIKMTRTFATTCWQDPQLEAEVLQGVSENPGGRAHSPLDRLGLQAAPVP